MILVDFILKSLISHDMAILQNAFLLVLRSKVMISDNSRYIAMHFDRLNEELINGTYGKRVEEELQKKKQKTNSDIQINNVDNDEIKEDLKD